MRTRAICLAGLLFVVAVCCALEGCGGFSQLSSGGHHSPARRTAPAGRALGRFLATVRPDQGTVTFVPADAPGQARTKLHGFGHPDALRLVSSNVKQGSR